MTEIPDPLSSWVRRQRWYAGKGGAARLGLAGSITLAEGDGWTIRILVIRDSGDRPALYQVPISQYRERPSELEAALIGTMAEGPESPGPESPGAGSTGIESEGTPPGARDRRHWYDAPRDPRFAAALLGLMLDGRRAGPAPGSPLTAQGRAAPGWPGGPVRLLSGTVLEVDQSNTSIVCALGDAAERPAGESAQAPPPLILKVFRMLAEGENPDVVLQSALAAAGSRHVPRPAGQVQGRWPRADGSLASGHLAFAQEFLPDARDGWRLAFRAAADGEDFAEQAADLGRATADVHEMLARTLPSRSAEAADIAATVAGMRRRLAEAESDAPAIADRHDAIEAVIAGTAGLEWPRLQRIHGDYHLGQVLATAKGWMLIDFEGEPHRPLAERTQPDLHLRDIAGMMRSFDYVGANLRLAEPGRRTEDWVRSAQQGFLRGYAERSGQDPQRYAELLRAFVLDKALYELSYEARHRPDWQEIPLQAVRRLSAGADDPPDAP